MTLLSGIDWIEMIGWLASVLTVATYAMNTMMLLRMLALASSAAFLVYGLVNGLVPLVAMELILMPINAYRLWQILRLRARLEAAEGAPADFTIIRRYGKQRRIPAGTLIFERGDPVDQLYYVEKGQISIEEPAVTIEPGNIFGEIAFFTASGVRTATARGASDAVVYELDKKRFMRLQFEDPGFGLAVMRLVTQRLVDGPPPTPPTARA